jgi:hypothetical protein
MKRPPYIERFARYSCLAITIVGLTGCSVPSVNSGSRSTSTQVTQALSPGAAAELAAKLANDESERLYKKRPFTAKQHPAVLEGDLYRWGRLDPGGPSGLSAVVTFRRDGTQPDVKVYFSTDTVRSERPK